MILTERYDGVLKYASDLHRNQMRKGDAGVPYISHLMTVSSLVLEHGGDEDEAIAALLHDGVEDQGGQKTLETIREMFGDTVASIFDGCSDSHGEPKSPWKERKDAYIAGIATKDDSTILVSACDKIHNARSILSDLRQIGDQVYDRFFASKQETIWYYRSLADAFKARGNLAVFDELDRVVQEIENV